MSPRRKQRRPPESAPEAVTAARETLERRWFRHTRATPELARCVTGTDLAAEPRHRWLPYKQGFAPALVRAFLEELAEAAPDASAPVLDPFAGAGTTPIECGRQGVAALGVEALPVLTFVAQQKAADAFQPIPDVGTSTTLSDFAPRFSHPLHQAALICAVARQHTSDGRALQAPPPLRAMLRDVLQEMRADLRDPLAAPVRIDCGDARNLGSVPTASVRGILTSPPYLSRHDYTRNTDPLDNVFRTWHPGTPTAAQRERQVRAHPRAYRQAWQERPSAALQECCTALETRGAKKLAGIVRSYFEDMHAALGEMHRVLRADGIVWLVVGGARLKGVYVPSDLMLAESAKLLGLHVSELRVARRLIEPGRKLGGLGDVAPRESILVLRRA